MKIDPLILDRVSAAHRQMVDQPSARELSPPEETYFGFCEVTRGTSTGGCRARAGRTTYRRDIGVIIPPLPAIIRRVDKPVYESGAKRSGQVIVLTGRKRAEDIVDGRARSLARAFSTLPAGDVSKVARKRKSLYHGGPIRQIRAWRLVVAFRRLRFSRALLARIFARRTRSLSRACRRAENPTRFTLNYVSVIPGSSGSLVVARSRTDRNLRY